MSTTANRENYWCRSNLDLPEHQMLGVHVWHSASKPDGCVNIVVHSKTGFGHTTLDNCGYDELLAMSVHLFECATALKHYQLTGEYNDFASQ